MQLVSKIQFKNYETGEFSSISSRTAEETFLLIENFPWSEQRHLTSVQLTCPSVTIERNKDSFLKIGPYFNGKFCLYLYENGKLFQRPIQTLADCKETLVDYYKSKDISPEFEKISLAVNMRKYFFTAPFEYRVTGKHILSFLLFPEIVMTIPLLCMLFATFLSSPEKPRAPAIVAFLLLFIFLIGINLYLFFNYYFYSKSLYLKVAKGQDDFYFGREDQYKQYSKNNIADIVVYKHRNQRVNWSYYAVFEINFKNGDQIIFPSLLLKEHLMDKKFAGKRITNRHTFFPTIPGR